MIAAVFFLRVPGVRLRSLGTPLRSPVREWGAGLYWSSNPGRAPWDCICR